MMALHARKFRTIHIFRSKSEKKVPERQKKFLPPHHGEPSPSWGGLPMRFSDITFAILNRFPCFLAINVRITCPQLSHLSHFTLEGWNVEKPVPLRVDFFTKSFFSFFCATPYFFRFLLKIAYFVYYKSGDCLKQSSQQRTFNFWSILLSLC